MPQIDFDDQNVAKLLPVNLKPFKRIKEVSNSLVNGIRRRSIEGITCIMAGGNGMPMALVQPEQSTTMYFCMTY